MSVQNTTPQQAAMAVCGSCLIDSSVIGEVRSMISIDHFQPGTATAIIFAAITALHDRGEYIDMLTVSDEVERGGYDLMEYRIPTILIDMINEPTAMYATSYAEIVRRDGQLRKQKILAQKLITALHEPDADPRQTQSLAIKEFSELDMNDKRDIQHIRGPLADVLDRTEHLARNGADVVGVPSGFTMLDKMLGGFQKSDLVIVAARPGMGKSSLAMTMVRNAAILGARVAFFSLEMSNEQLVQRLLSMETRIDSHRLRLGQIHENEWPILTQKANEVANMPIFIDDTPALNVTEIRTKAMKLYAEHGLDMIVVDYLQLMSGVGKNENRQQEISHISRSLAALAKEFDVPVIALSQLSRAVETRADKRGVLSDLRESGAIEQDGSVVIFIYRDDYYYEDSDQQNIAELIVAKHRHGSTGTVKVYFEKEFTQFKNLELQRTEFHTNGTGPKRQAVTA